MKRILQCVGGSSLTVNIIKQTFAWGALLCVVSSVQGQILVDSNGSTNEGFGAIPLATSWSTKSLAGAAGDYAFTNGNNTITAMDAAVNGAGNAAI